MNRPCQIGALSPRVPRRTLGGTGLDVSVLGLGTVKLGRNQGVKYPTRTPLPSDDEARALLHAALDLDINLIDTAPAYGTSEERLGVLLAGIRDRVVLITKCGEEFAEGVSSFDFTPIALRASVERSLRRLRTDRLDCVLLHSDGIVETTNAREDALGALARLREAGKVRAIGLSTKTAGGGLWAVEHGDVAMLTLNRQATADVPAVARAKQLGKGVLIKKALGSGFLALPANASDGRSRACDPAPAGPEARLRGATEAGGAKHDPVEDALRYVLESAGVSSIVVGTTSPEHLRHNVHALQRALAAAPGKGRLPLP